MTTVLAFAFVLGVLVFVHELGHFLLARWHGVRHRRHVHNAEQRFDLHAVQTWATVEWTGRSGSVVYTSDPAETSRTEFAELAFERNGSYFT